VGSDDQRRDDEPERRTEGGTYREALRCPQSIVLQIRRRMNFGLVRGRCGKDVLLSRLLGRDIESAYFLTAHGLCSFC